MARQEPLKQQLKSFNSSMTYSSSDHCISISIQIKDVYTSNRANDIYKWILAAIKERQVGM